MQRPKKQRLPKRSIKTEAEAWRQLKAIVDGNADWAPFMPVVRQWPNFELTFWVGGPGVTLTTPIMKGLIEYQSCINRAFLLVEEGSTNLRSLSEEERQEFEARFRVRRGSTQVNLDLQELADKLGKKALSKLTGKQITAIILAFAVIFGGNSYWKAWLEHQKEVSIAETNNEITKEILKEQHYADATDLERFRLLTEVLHKVIGNNELETSSESGRQMVLKAASQVQNSRIGGVEISPQAAKPMVRNARTPADEETLFEDFDVVRVDTEVEDGFRVRLRNVGTGEEFFATVRDVLSSTKDRSLIQRGEWEKKPIKARVVVYRRRGTITSAMIAEVVEVVGASDKN